jgi:hypothetical protein
VLATTAALLAASLALSPVRSLFAFDSLSGGDFIRLSAVAIATIGLLELTKLVWQPKQPHRSHL